MSHPVDEVFRQHHREKGRRDTRVKGESDGFGGEDRRLGTVLAAEYGPYSRHTGGPERGHRRPRQRRRREKAGRPADETRFRTVTSSRSKERGEGYAAGRHRAFYQPQHQGRRHEKRSQTERDAYLHKRGPDESAFYNRVGGQKSQAGEQGGRHVDARRHRVCEGRGKLYQIFHGRKTVEGFQR